MTIHYACRTIFNEVVKGILLRTQMDAATFQTMDRVGRDWNYVRRAIDPAVSGQNVEIQMVMRDLLSCECPIFREGRT